ncbi:MULTISPECIES: ATP-grasp fold amidoligase family protein [Collinsella]|uniref:ATP-grasp fold amidoligase family protein n=1 Tax=Collinsella TaxID=102106 RepID=UPI001313F616|nr:MULTISPECIES: ATP-grasp fold amidoligase family protein [Collinsella]
MPDEIHLKIMYRALIGKNINLDNPKGFNEKLNWLKLHDRNPLYNILVDKLAVKQWVADKIGAQYVSETYDSWDRVESISLENLPEQFVLKTNHDSGGVAICRDKSSFDFDAAKRVLRRHLKSNYFWWTREWPYKDVTPMVMAEEYLEDEGFDTGLVDYKVTCFNGNPRLIEVHRGRFGEHTCNYYDQDWNPVTIDWAGIPVSPVEVERPEKLEKMLELSSVLTRGIPQVRCDWYVLGDRLVFGELTLFNGAGLDPIDEKNDLWLGSLIDLSLAYGDQ